MKNVEKLSSFFKASRPLWVGLAFVIVVVTAHFTAVDPGARDFSDEDLKALPNVNRTLEKLRTLPDEEDASAGKAPSDQSTNSVLWGVRRILEVTGFRQNWRIGQSPAPEIQGFEIRAYHKMIKPMTGVYRTVFAICAELDNTGECAPEIRSRIELEMLKGIERTKSPVVIEAFTRYVVARASKKFSEEYRKVEFIAYRHALKTTRDYSKRANTQILLTQDL